MVEHGDYGKDESGPDNDSMGFGDGDAEEGYADGRFNRRQ